MKPIVAQHTTNITHICDEKQIKSLLDGTINQGKNEKLWIALMKNVFSALNKMLNRMLEKTEPEECREGISCSGQTNMRQLQKN